MILLDVNILIYAVNEHSALHHKAKLWLEKIFVSHETVALSWNVLLAFLRLTTRAGAFRNPMPLDTAFEILDGWLAQPSVVVLHPGPRHSHILRDLLLPLGAGGNLTSDAHLAALAIEHGAELCSSDSDFARFPGLQWRNPFAPT
jgi:toxin-antitoxin system PIN domain toxin